MDGRGIVLHRARIIHRKSTHTAMESIKPGGGIGKTSMDSCDAQRTNHESSDKEDTLFVLKTARNAYYIAGTVPPKQETTHTEQEGSLAEQCGPHR